MSLSILLPLLLGATALTPAALGQFYSVGRPPGEFDYSLVTSLSSDGTVAGGYVLESSEIHAFTWTRSGGRSEFGRGAGMPQHVYVDGLSGDGRIAVGTYLTPDGRGRAYRWGGSGPLVSLGSVGGFWPNSQSAAANRDGSVIVGTVRDNSGNFFEPFRWTEAGGMQMLRQNNGSEIYGEANAVSDDGNTVIGHSLAASRGFVWTAANGYRLLDGLPGVEVYSTALGMSRNGNFIVGDAGIISTGVMWSSNGVIDLGKLPGYRSFSASEVNETGTVVAGNSTGFQYLATVWTQTRGIEPLADYLASMGVSVPMGVVLNSCDAMSADGLTFAGSASINRDPFTAFGYVVTIPSPPCTVFYVIGGSLLVTRRRRR